MLQKDNEQIMFLFTQVMGELRDIKKEIKDLNRVLATTVERQAATAKDLRALEDTVKPLALLHLECPARQALNSRNHLVKETTTWLALVLSMTAIWKTFWG